MNAQSVKKLVYLCLMLIELAKAASSASYTVYSLIAAELQSYNFNEASMNRLHIRAGIITYSLDLKVAH